MKPDKEAHDIESERQTDAGAMRQVSKFKSGRRKPATDRRRITKIDHKDDANLFPVRTLCFEHMSSKLPKRATHREYNKEYGRGMISYS